MLVSLNPYRPSLAINRIEAALRQYAPESVEWVEPEEAELIIFPVIGRHDQTTRKAQQLLSEGRKYAVIQLALKSTRNPDPADWLELWAGAAIVWSYYALPRKFNFYHAPLGADANIWYPLHIQREYMVGTTGSYTRTECLWEVEKAARMTDNRMLKIRADSDAEMNKQYNLCSFISGLRTKEGFELPAIEGMLAGARPILFDTPTFRQWYDGVAEFIPEGNMLATMNQLIALFRRGPVPVTGIERRYAMIRFDWKWIIGGFWECVL